MATCSSFFVINTFMKLFGFEVPTIFADKEAKEIKDDKEVAGSFAPPVNTDGAEVITAYASGFTAQTLAMNTADNDVKNLIRQYREAALLPECDKAISEISDAAIISGAGTPIQLDLSSADDLTDKVKDEIQAEFKSVMRLFKMKQRAHDLFRQWYVDGRLYFHLVVDSEKPEEGIKKIVQLDPVHVRKIREIKRIRNKNTGVETLSQAQEYFIYNGEATQQNLRIHNDAIIYSPSGLVIDTHRTDQPGQGVAVSHLHKSLKIINQLRMMEDALVIYRIARAPERRIFYIDVGNLPKGKAEEYVQGIMSRHKNKMVYDVNSGKVSDTTKSMSMLEDFWLPRKEGGRGTEITTLPGGDNLSQIDDVVFFQKKMYRSLNVPVQRLESEAQYTPGQVSDISREEVKFQKFVDRLRRSFESVVVDTLKAQCVLRQICTTEEWDDIADDIIINFIEDNAFAELKKFEIMKERIDMLSALDESIGTYFSKAWVRKNILQLSDEDIKQMQSEIDDEAGDDDGEDEDDY